MKQLKRMDPNTSISPPTLADETPVALTGADWNEMAERVEALEAKLADQAEASSAESRS